MSIQRLGSPALPAATSSAPPTRPQPAQTAGAGLRGSLSGLTNKPPASAPQRTLTELPGDLLNEVMQRTFDLADPPRQAARQLARLMPVSKDFHSAAADVLRHLPEAAREALANRVMRDIKDAEDEWARRGWAPKDKERIEACLATALQSLDRVIVSLDGIGLPLQPGEMMDMARVERRPQMVQVVADVLARHPRLRALEVTACENQQLSCMAQLAGRRPDLLRSLVVKTPAHLAGSSEASHARAALSKVLPGQKHLATLTLQDARDSISGQRPLNLREARLDDAIAALPSLKSLTLSHYRLTQDDAGALAGVLRQMPALEDLDLSNNVLDAADFSQIASSLPAVAGLRSLNLQSTSLTGASAEHLAHVLPGLAELRTLNLATTGMVATDMERLGDGLAGMKQLQALDVSHNLLDHDGRFRLIAALARVPTLRHLHLRARWHEKPPNLDMLKDDLAPLAGNRELQVHLSRPSAYDAMERQRMARLQAEMPRIHFRD